MTMMIQKELAIYTAIHSIPVGKVSTYGNIAKLAGCPNNARLVGTLLKNLPDGSSLPWHRVINSQGKISFEKDSSKYTEQFMLLCSEGVVFNKGKVDLKLYGI